MARLFSGVYFSQELTHAALLDLIHQAIDDGASSLWVSLCGHGEVAIHDISNLARSLPCPLLGSVMPGFIDGECSRRFGIMVIGFLEPIRATLICGLDRGRAHIEQQILERIDGDCSSDGLLVVLDGLSSGIEALVRSLYDLLGTDRQVIGGGAGYSDFRRAPCLADAGGVYQDAAAIFSLPVPIATTVRHGWQELEGPFLVTQARGNRIQTLNYQPAFDVYRQVLKSKLDLTIDPHNFNDVAGSFPFGLRQLDSEVLVRDPVALDGNSLICVGEVPEHSLIYILTAERRQLIEAAESSIEDLLPRLGSGYYRDSASATSQNQLRLFMVDCISRALFLGDDFEAELQAIQKQLPESVSLIGMLTLGELVSSKQGSVNFLNKTIVLGGLAS